MCSVSHCLSEEVRRTSLDQTKAVSAVFRLSASEHVARNGAKNMVISGEDWCLVVQSGFNKNLICMLSISFLCVDRQSF